jgi:hypothetical protein
MPVRASKASGDRRHDDRRQGIASAHLIALDRPVILPARDNDAGSRQSACQHTSLVSTSSSSAKRSYQRAHQDKALQHFTRHAEP